jgi:CheY-like chemotaxis protein
MPEGRKKILVVDDEPSDLDMIRDNLQGEGHKVLTAADGEAAKQLYRDNSPIDLLVTDVAMTPINGCDLANSLINLQPDLKVMFVSGYTGAEVLRQGSVAGVKATFLRKPFTREGLIYQVREFLKADYAAEDPNTAERSKGRAAPGFDPPANVTHKCIH